MTPAQSTRDSSYRELRILIEDAVFHTRLNITVMKQQIKRLQKFGEVHYSLSASIERSQRFIRQAEAVLELPDRLEGKGGADPVPAPLPPRNPDPSASTANKRFMDATPYPEEVRG